MSYQPTETQKKAEDLRWKMSECGLNELERVCKSLADTIGCSLSISGGCVYEWDTDFHDFHYSDRKNVESHIDVRNIETGDVVDGIWAIEGEWNSWVPALQLIEEEMEDLDGDEWWEADEMLDSYRERALKNMSEICSRWFESVEECWWQYEDDEIFEMAKESKVA